jgi:heat shock protein HtpX
MFLGAAGLRTHIWNNNLKSVLLLAGFPVLLMFLGYAAALIWIAMTGEGVVPVSGGDKGTSYYADPTLWQSMQAALHILPNIALFSSLAAGVWFVIAWFSHQAIINAATGARTVERKDETRLYNLLENLCISRGLSMPKLAIIESEGRNAFASGLREGQYTITVTRGLMDMLDDDELEGVLAHELSHIRHADVRLLVISVIFVGIISFVVQLVFRGLLHGGLRGGSRRGGGGSKNAGLLVVIAMAFIAIAYLLAIAIRFTLSRRREYMADAGAVELTKNPDAMISALMKISDHSAVGRAPDSVREMFIENPKTGFMGMFATHPPMDKRIDMLVEHAGGNRPHPTVPVSSIPEA